MTSPIQNNQYRHYFEYPSTVQQVTGIYRQCTCRTAGPAVADEVRSEVYLPLSSDPVLHLYAMVFPERLRSLKGAQFCYTSGEERRST